MKTNTCIILVIKSNTITRVEHVPYMGRMRNPWRYKAWVGTPEEKRPLGTP